MAHVLTVTLDGQPHSVDLDRLTFAEGRAVEKVTGMEIADAMKKMSLTAVQAFVWVTVKRDRPELKFADLDNVAMSDVDLDITDGTEAEEAPADPTVPAAAG